MNAEELKNFKICIIPLEIQRHVSQLSDEAWSRVRLSKSLYMQAENLLLEELGLRGLKPKFELSYTANLSQAFKVHRVDAEYFQPAYDEIVTSSTIQVWWLPSFVQPACQVGVSWKP